MSRPILLLVNPVAGGKIGSGPGLADDPAQLEPAALAGALRSRGLTVDLHELEESDDVARLAREAAANGSDVVVAGGDGTVSAAAAALVETEATLGILAMGSFNNIAHGLDVPRHLPEALEVIASDRAGKVDVGRAQRAQEPAVYFFESGGVGLDAELFSAAQANTANQRGVALRMAWRALRRARQRVQLTVDGRSIRTSAFLVTASNGPYYGWGFTIAAQADVTDGQMEVRVFSQMSTWQTVRHFIAIARGRHRYEPRIRRLRARSVTIEGTRRTLPTHADGQPLGPTPITFEAVPAALRVFRDHDLARAAARALGEDDA
jgi:diacylglycerol kinase (ATP)